MKTITIQISDSAYESLRLIAHGRGSTVTDICQGATMDLARQWNLPVPRQVAELHQQGLWVGDIAAALGMTNAAVRAIMVTLRLHSNPKPHVRRPVNPRARKKK